MSNPDRKNSNNQNLRITNQIARRAMSRTMWSMNPSPFAQLNLVGMVSPLTSPSSSSTLCYLCITFFGNFAPEQKYSRVALIHVERFKVFGSCGISGEHGVTADPDARSHEG